MPYCNTDHMNVFLKELSKEYAGDDIILVCDGAAWHKSNTIELPDNITLVHIPPYTPEMNPIEQIWRELRTQGFKNEVLPTLKKVVDRLFVTINNLTKSTVSKITLRHWISAVYI